MSASATGALLGALLAIVGSTAPRTLRMTIGLAAAVVLLAVAALELGTGRVLIVQRNRETSRERLYDSSLRWPITNGIALGSGFWSRITFPLLYAVFCGCFLVAQPILGASLMGLYACVRTAAVVPLGFVVDRWGFHETVARMDRAKVAAMVGCATLLSAVAATACAIFGSELWGIAVAHAPSTQ